MSSIAFDVEISKTFLPELYAAKIDLYFSLKTMPSSHIGSAKNAASLFRLAAALFGIPEGI